MLPRKILASILTDLPEEALLRQDTVLPTYLKEFMLGVLLTLFGLSVLFFVDLLLALRFPTARTFRRATSQLMNDRDIMKSLEENADWKFLNAKEYEGMLQEIASAKNRTMVAQHVL